MSSQLQTCGFILFQVVLHQGLGYTPSSEGFWETMNWMDSSWSRWCPTKGLGYTPSSEGFWSWVTNEIHFVIACLLQKRVELSLYIQACIIEYTHQHAQPAMFFSED